NYPITVFDHPDRSSARWPTIGIHLSARDGRPVIHSPVRNVLHVTKALVETMLEGTERRRIDDPESIARTVFVDTSGVAALDFDQSPEQVAQLVEAGRDAAREHLAARFPGGEG
ncbi:MAG TPA: esterase, partial [Brevibacterium sp.]|nr:esterase [Brevibacterium sp.]